MINKLIETHFLLAKEAKGLAHKRYLFGKINWGSRLIGIVGSRGVGKTTLMLQHYLENYDTPEDCLYISADNINVANKGLYNLAEEFFNFGGKVILIDEVQKYPNWQLELKNIYDSFPSKRIVFSGSSTINILKGKADLSRRAAFYNLKGLSFREFLSLHIDKRFDVLKPDELLRSHVKIAGRISSEVPILKHFVEYLRFGYYPFFKEGLDLYHSKLDNVIEKIFYEDIPLVFNVKPSSIYNLKRLFYLVATSQPFIPNVSRISAQLGISKEYIYAYIEELEKAGLFLLLHEKAAGFKLSRKPQKIYLENPNLFALMEEAKGFSAEKGNIRETFFLNQALSMSRLYSSEKADFVDAKGRLYEIGGKDKASNYFAICDGINIGFKNKIPLWLFGFLY